MEAEQSHGGKEFVFASERTEWEAQRTGGGGGERVWVLCEKTDEEKYRCYEEMPQTKCCLEEVSGHLGPLGSWNPSYLNLESIASSITKSCFGERVLPCH